MRENHAKCVILENQGFNRPKTNNYLKGINVCGIINCGIKVCEINLCDFTPKPQSLIPQTFAKSNKSQRLIPQSILFFQSQTLIPQNISIYYDLPTPTTNL